VTVPAQCRTCTDLRDLWDCEFHEYEREHGKHAAFVVRRDKPEIQFIMWSDFYKEYLAQFEHHPDTRVELELDNCSKCGYVHGYDGCIA
jgi:hypothetical protein